MLPIDGTSPKALPRSVNAQDPNWGPRAEWVTAPAGGVRDSIAIPSALVTSAAVGEISIDQPTTRREHTSSTTAQYTLPPGPGAR